MSRILSHPLLLLLPWLLLIVSMWLSDERRNLTVAWHDYILAAGTIIALLGAVAWFILPREQGDTRPMSWTQLLVQCLPLYCIGAIHTGSLTMDADSDITRMRVPVVYNALSAESPALMIPHRAGEGDQPFDDTFNSSRDSSTTIIDGVALNQYARSVDLLELNMPAQRQQGGRVVIVGRILKPTQKRLNNANDLLATIGDFDPVNGALFRFVMTCCAADAQPMSAFLNLPDPRAFQQGDWVEVTGILVQTDNSLPAMIKVEQAHIISEPKRPYLTIPITGAR